jgi:hypothetical protein
MTRTSKPSRLAKLSVDELVNKFAEISITQSEALQCRKNRAAAR